MELEVAAALLDASRRLSSGDVARDISAQEVGNHFIRSVLMMKNYI